MFLKQKRCGRIKYRGFVNGRPQRAYIYKEESSAPPVTLVSFFISFVMDAMEVRNVTTVNIHGDFMQIDQEGTVFVHLTGLMVRLLLKINSGNTRSVLYGSGENRYYKPD